MASTYHIDPTVSTIGSASTLESLEIFRQFSEKLFSELTIRARNDGFLRSIAELASIETESRNTLLTEAFSERATLLAPWSQLVAFQATRASEQTIQRLKEHIVALQAEKEGFAAEWQKQLEASTQIVVDQQREQFAKIQAVVDQTQLELDKMRRVLSELQSRDEDTGSGLRVLQTVAKYNLDPVPFKDFKKCRLTTIDFVIDVSASMATAGRMKHLQRHLQEIHDTSLQHFGPVKWNLFVFGNHCVRYSGTDGRPYTFEDTSVTPHGVLAEHLRTKGYQMGTLFLPAAQQLADAIAEDKGDPTRDADRLPRHHVFWFTDGHPEDHITLVSATTNDLSYEATLIAPCRELHGRIRDRLASFKVFSLKEPENAAEEYLTAIPSFAEAWGGESTAFDSMSEILGLIEQFNSLVETSLQSGDAA